MADALARRGTIGAQLSSKQAGLDAAADNAGLPDRHDRGGIDSYLQSLAAQQALYSAERALISTRLLRATNLVGLYRAIGGDSPGSEIIRSR